MHAHNSARRNPSCRDDELAMSSKAATAIYCGGRSPFHRLRLLCIWLELAEKVNGVERGPVVAKICGCGLSSLLESLHLHCEREGKGGEMVRFFFPTMVKERCFMAASGLVQEQTTISVSFTLPVYHHFSSEGKDFPYHFNGES
ncbi:unnamed protein product [Lactuca saligna]|uniref:Uncharacterized protein n=1 Tax=Lactuca saligna TaxID=75948 RepID=A0AA35YS48_LACSI|nr:unnamed protein product [Lactuca saligna]